jgi:hypothetical protein
MMGDHRGAGAGRNYDILCAFEHFQEVTGDGSRLLAITAVERRLSATGLRLAKFNLAPSALEHLRHRYTDLGKNLVHDAGHED